MNEKEFKERYINRLKKQTGSGLEYQWMKDSAVCAWDKYQEDGTMEPEDMADVESSCF